MLSLSLELVKDKDAQQPYICPTGLVVLTTLLDIKPCAGEWQIRVSTLFPCGWRLIIPYLLVDTMQIKILRAITTLELPIKRSMYINPYKAWVIRRIMQSTCATDTFLTHNEKRIIYHATT